MTDKMQRVTNVVSITSGLLLCVGPYTVFKSCETTEKMMRCAYSVRMEFLIGGLIILISVISLFECNTWKYYFLNVLVWCYGIIIPAFVIGGCANSDMRCQSVTFPLFYIISIANIVLSILGLMVDRRRTRKCFYPNA